MMLRSPSRLPTSLHVFARRIRICDRWLSAADLLQRCFENEEGDSELAQKCRSASPAVVRKKKPHSFHRPQPTQSTFKTPT